MSDSSESGDDIVCTTFRFFLDWDPHRRIALTFLDKAHAGDILVDNSVPVFAYWSDVFHEALANHGREYLKELEAASRWQYDAERPDQWGTRHTVGYSATPVAVYFDFNIPNDRALFQEFVGIARQAEVNVSGAERAANHELFPQSAQQEKASREGAEITDQARNPDTRRIEDEDAQNLMAHAVDFHLLNSGDETVRLRVSRIISEQDSLGLVAIGRYYAVRHPDNPETIALVADIQELGTWQTRNVGIQVELSGSERGMRYWVSCPRCDWSAGDFVHFAEWEGFGSTREVRNQSHQQASYLKMQRLLRQLHQHTLQCDVEHC